MGFSIRGAIILAGGVVLALGASNTNLTGQNHLSGVSPAFEAGVGTHQTGIELQTAPGFPSATEMPAQGEIEIPAPTRSTFMASWPSVNGALGYILDVSTSDSFSSYVDGYHDLDVGNVTARVVAGLNRGTTYYYRVRAYGATGPASDSAVMRITTEPTTGLIINPTFDSSITGNPNAAAIEAMINRAISFYESLFSDPVTIQIRFRYSTTGPDGTPLGVGAIAQSDFVIYRIPWGTYIAALRADARTSNDSVANASLPATALSPNIQPRSAGGRAVGLDTPPAMLPNGTIGQGGPYDGIVTLNPSAPYQFTRPTSAGHLDAQRSTEHEVDEVIGLGSRLGHTGSDLHPQDLFSWSSAGHRNLTSSGVRYFSINGGVSNIVNFNQNPDGDFGDWLSTACPQAHPYVQNAFGCAGQSSDIAATSPEGINLDVIGYDLAAGGCAGFNDVPAGSPFCPFIEELVRRGITSGCGGGNYCPEASVDRAQMAVFLLRTLEGSGYTPPPCVPGQEMFNDVPASSPFCPWIGELARRGITGGCGGGNYCPSASVTRAQMAVFLLRTLEGSGYTPPPCVPGQEMFNDVPASSPFCPWIGELARRGITGGCGGGNYCPGASVDRAQMAVFLVRTF